MTQEIDDFDSLHDVAAGRHFYQFYKSAEDLYKVLIPYWQAGVEKGNFCFWVVPVFLTLENARELLSAAIPDLDRLIAEGKFELAAHADWYGDGETFDGDGVLGKYIGKIEEAISRGFSVVRIAGDTSGFKPHLWPLFQEYEKKGHAEIDSLPCIVLCSYSLHDLRLQQTKDVLDHHHGVLIAKV